MGFFLSYLFSCSRAPLFICLCLSFLLVSTATTGGVVACSSGANLTPHIITVAAGEDVTMKIISFSQKGSHAICILSANGVISNVTLRQPDSSGGTLTYEVWIPPVANFFSCCPLN